jgi:hypothetical protein
MLLQIAARLLPQNSLWQVPRLVCFTLAQGSDLSTSLPEGASRTLTICDALPVAKQLAATGTLPAGRGQAPRLGPAALRIDPAQCALVPLLSGDACYIVVFAVASVNGDGALTLSPAQDSIWLRLPSWHQQGGQEANISGGRTEGETVATPHAYGIRACKSVATCQPSHHCRGSSDCLTPSLQHTEVEGCGSCGILTGTVHALPALPAEDLAQRAVVLRLPSGDLAHVDMFWPAGTSSALAGLQLGHMLMLCGAQRATGTVQPAEAPAPAGTHEHVSSAGGEGDGPGVAAVQVRFVWRATMHTIRPRRAAFCEFGGIPAADSQRCNGRRMQATCLPAWVCWGHVSCCRKRPCSTLLLLLSSGSVARCCAWQALWWALTAWLSTCAAPGAAAVYQEPMALTP